MLNRTGSRVDQSLLPGETVIFRTSEHWTAAIQSTILGIVFGLLGIILVAMSLSLPGPARVFGPGWGIGCLVFGVASFVIGRMYHQAHEYAVTDRRILFRTPRGSYDVFINRIEAVDVQTSLFGQYGTVLITTAGVAEIFRKVKACVQLARAIETQVKKLADQPQAVYMVPAPPPAGAAK